MRDIIENEKLSLQDLGPPGQQGSWEAFLHIAIQNSNDPNSRKLLHCVGQVEQRFELQKGYGTKEIEAG